jgi:threonine/homoserine/homoserine lactone efflux protein
MNMLGPFLLASVALAVTPGPGMLYIATRTLAEGRRAGFASVAGVALGNFANAALAALGLGALLALWPQALTLLRWAGAAYLAWLALQTWRLGGGAAPTADAGTLRQGFWVALLNPKTALFFAAFLPPFLDPAGSAAAQSLALGAIFVTVAALSDSLVVLGAAALRRPALARAGRAAGALVYLALAAYAAWGGGGGHPG